MTPKLIGLFIIAVPALALGALILWRRHRPVFLFYVALLAVGLGYLYATGATEDAYEFVVGDGSLTTLQSPVSLKTQPAQ